MKVLYLTHRLPYAPNRGDRIRSYHLLEGLRREAEVTLVSLVHDDEEASHVADVESRGVPVIAARTAGVSRWAGAALALAGTTPLTHALLDAPGLASRVDALARTLRPDVVVAFCSGMAQFAVRQAFDGVPFVLDMVDVDSEKWKDLGAITGFPKGWVYRREARVLSAFERAASERAVTALVVNDKERAALTRIAPGADVRTLPNGIDIDDFTPPGPPAAGSTVVFCGVMNYAPNEAGAVWLAREVWPRVVAAHPAARLEFVGSQPSAAVRALATDGIVVTGAVPHTRDHLWRAAVAVAPLHTARGLQNKVLEALAAGVPVVTTPAVRSGLPDALAPACDVADAAEAFADAIIARLRQTPAERRARATSVDLTPYSWQGPRRAFVDVVRAAAAISARR
ncbi:MAG: TIGR03087 family PEP-CTERM/XrtA system glycosyltransferase [Vicinamibacterales bacterium]